MRRPAYQYSNGRKFYDSGRAGLYEAILSVLRQETLEGTSYPAILNEDSSRLALE